jgi:hypothetical protein
MATPDAPPAPQPAETPAPQPASPAPSSLAQLLTAVEPARGSTASLPQSAPAPEPGAAGARESQSGGKGAAASNSGEGAFAALLRGIGARLARTGTARKITRTHTVSENRVSGSTSTTNNAANHTSKNDRSVQHRTARDAKLADLKNKAVKQEDRSGRDMKNHRNADAKTSDTKNAKIDSSDRNGRDVKNHRNSEAKTSDSTSSADSTTAKTDNSTKRDGAKEPKTPAKDGAARQPEGEKTLKPETGRPTQEQKDTNPGAAADPKRQDNQDNPPTSKNIKDNQAGASQPDRPAPAEQKAPGPKPRTQPSREAGLRDGLRVAEVTKHPKAYLDGLRDGLTLGDADYRQEKQQMDAARDANTRPAQPAMAPASGSTATLTKQTHTDQRTPAIPVQVDEVGDSHIHYTDSDGQQHNPHRSEVRTLCGFQRRLGDKQPTMQRIADAAKKAATHAEEQAKQAQDLAEGAKDVEGGDALVRSLGRLAEDAQALKTEAMEIYRRAVRGDEAVIAVVANAETRHGPIYQAVVDSPLTIPAETYFYRDK